MGIQETTLKIGEPIFQNPALHLRERGWNGGQYQILGKTIADSATVAGLLGELDLLGVAVKTITVHNVGANPLGVGSKVLGGPVIGAVTEEVSTGDYDSLAAGVVKSFSSTDAIRHWDLTLVGGGGGDTKVNIYVDVAIHG